MIKRLLFLLAGPALLAPATATAQAQWAAPGATWTYSYGLFWDYGDMTMTYAGPTTVGGLPAQVYSRQLTVKNRMNAAIPAMTSSLPSLVLRDDADRLYVLANDQQFYTLYNFAARVGESWLTPAAEPQSVCAGTLVRLRVDSVGTAVVGGVSRRWLRLRRQSLPGQQPAMDQPWGGRIYEGLGPMEAYLSPQGSFSCGGSDPGYLGGLMCFRATGQPTVYGGSAQRCSAIVTAAAEQRAAQLGFEVYPNPSQGELHLRLPAALGAGATVEIHDLTGRCVLRATATGTLDVRQLPKGLYALSLRQPGVATPATRRIVLQ